MSFCIVFNTVFKTPLPSLKVTRIHQIHAHSLVIYKFSKWFHSKEWHKLTQSVYLNSFNFCSGFFDIHDDTEHPHSIDSDILDYVSGVITGEGEGVSCCLIIFSGSWRTKSLINWQEIPVTQIISKLVSKAKLQ